VNLSYWGGTMFFGRLAVFIVIGIQCTPGFGKEVFIFDHSGIGAVSTIHEHPDWWAYNPQGDVYRVDIAAKKVDWQRISGRAVFQRPFGRGLWDRRISVDFRFGEPGGEEGPVWLTALEFGVARNRPGDIRLQLWRPPGKNHDQYQLYAVMGKDAEGITGSHRTTSKVFHRSEVGHNGKIENRSDLLRLSLYLCSSGDNNWLLEGTLENVETGDTIAEVSFASAALSELYNTADLYAVIHSGTPSAFELYSFKTEPELVPQEPVAIEDGYRLWGGDKPVLNHDELPLLQNVEFHVIKPFQPEKDGYRWHHGVALEWHNRLLYASFGVHPHGENIPETDALYSVSSDEGKSWSDFMLIDSGTKEPPTGVGFGALLSHEETLWSFQGSFKKNHKDGLHTRVYSLEESTGTWRWRGVIPEPFFPNQNPVRMDNGNWIMSGVFIGEDGSPAAVAISEGENFERWSVTVIPKVEKSWAFGESAVLINGSNIMNIARYNQDPGQVALVAFSEDYGHTWTRSTPSNLPMTGTMPESGTLSTGHNYLIATTAGDSARIKKRFWDRTPLTIALTRPGEWTFSKVFVIRHAESDTGPGESHPEGRLHYPGSLEHNGKLYVAYSNGGGRSGNYNSIELAVIPLDSLTTWSCTESP
jgi:hypothetical protein